jgi:threonine efflux protein
MLANYLPALLVAYTTYFIGTASPGPANLAIMSTAMDCGRRQAMAFAAGVISGSQMWGIISAVGIGALFARYTTALSVMKLFGGLYLIWLGYGALRARSAKPKPAAAMAGPEQSLGRHYLRGLGLHVTNPKAMLVWFTTISLGMPTGAPGYVAVMVLAGCAVIGCLVFFTYAIVFSTKPMIQLYTSYKPTINLVLAIVFAVAGVKLIAAQLAPLGLL